MLAAMRYLLVSTLLTATSMGCTKNVDALPATSDASVTAAPSSSSAAAVKWDLSIDAHGTTHVDMSGAALPIVGDTSASMGSLVVTPSDLSQSRGAVIIDLASFTTHALDGGADDAKHTKEAAAWFELVGDAGSGQSFRWASFAIRSIGGLSASDLTKVAPSKDGGTDVRTVTMTLHGDLLLHGHKVQRDTVVDVSFRYPAGAPAESKPLRVEIATKDPVNLVLKDFDVRPRDASTGALAPRTSKATANMAPSANVSVKLSASPSSS
jgi:hypothetical protein